MSVAVRDYDDISRRQKQRGLIIDWSPTSAVRNRVIGDRILRGWEHSANDLTSDNPSIAAPQTIEHEGRTGSHSNLGDSPLHSLTVDLC